MSARFVNIDRETPMLLPVDLREWVGGDDLAHFVWEAVEGLEVEGAAINQRGSGREQYPPGEDDGVIALLLCERDFQFAADRSGHPLARSGAEGRRLYALRNTTIEPTFGVIKSVLGFRRFQWRRLRK